MDTLREKQDRYFRKQYEFDEQLHGCGYWKVCDDHACPCSSTAKVNQGYDLDVYVKLKRELEEELDYY